MAPVIHEWTYEAMVYDLLALSSNAYEYETQTEGGATEMKTHMLDERDPVWTELRHQHFADASLKISTMAEEFTKKNKTASYIRGRGGVSKCPLNWAIFCLLSASKGLFLQEGPTSSPTAYSSL